MMKAKKNDDWHTISEKTNPKRSGLYLVCGVEQTEIFEDFGEFVTPIIRIAYFRKEYRKGETVGVWERRRFDDLDMVCWRELPDLPEVTYFCNELKKHIQNGHYGDLELDEWMFESVIQRGSYDKLEHR